MYFNLIKEEIEQYCIHHTEMEDPTLKELKQKTIEGLKYPQMLSDHLQGKFLSFISSITKPKLILEIGTFTGYSTLCLAKGLSSEGRLITIEKNEEAAKLAKTYFKRSEYADQIELLETNALEWLKQNEIPPLDLAFIDADKANTLNYYEHIVPKLRKGGVLLVDNVLWNGKVTQGIKENDKETITIDAFNKLITKDLRMENLLLPFRDGIMMARKCE